MKKRFIDYQKKLIKSLQDPEEALAYLNAALEDKDPRIFLLAIKNVLEAQGDSVIDLSKVITMSYDGFPSKIIYDNETKIFHGEITILKDVITFQGSTVHELEKALKDSTNDYRAWCKESSSTKLDT